MMSLERRPENQAAGSAISVKTSTGVPGQTAAEIFDWRELAIFDGGNYTGLNHSNNLNARGAAGPDKYTEQMRMHLTELSLKSGRPSKVVGMELRHLGTDHLEAVQAKMRQLEKPTSPKPNTSFLTGIGKAVLLTPPNERTNFY